MTPIAARPPFAFALFATSVAMALPVSLFAVSSALALCSSPSPFQSALGHIAHITATMLLSIVPSLLALCRHFLRRWAVSALLVAIVCLFASMQALPHIHATDVLTNPAIWTFFFVALAFMIVAALLGRGVRSLVSRHKWITFSCAMLAYIGLVAAGFVFTAIPLYAE